MLKRKSVAVSAIILCLTFILMNACTINIKNIDSLSNKNADGNAVVVYNYISDIYGNSILSGQQESVWMDSPEYEMEYIYNVTGKLPALRGFDFMDDDFDSVVSRAIQWWKKGGLVSICWHCGPDFSGNYDNCKNDEIADWEKILTDGTPENIEFIKNMDKAGAALKELQLEGVPVLWRPFHEFDGGWFWWGKGGSENFKQLWIMMYDHFTNDLELNNLIWVLGYSHNGTDYKNKPAEWYPGDEYCDIVGADSYEVAENGAEKRLYKILQGITRGKKPLILHECGKIPTIEQFGKVKWCSFMTWHTEWLIESNTEEELKLIYNSEYTITLDDLPFKK